MADPRDHEAAGPALSRLRAFDRLGVLLGLAIGIPSLLYPFGSDQAAFHYVASGWLEGAWPYVDSIDHRPPGIHAVYAIAIWLLGPGESPIRVFDLALVVAIGLAIPRLLRAGPPWPGESGAAVLLLATSYYTIFDYGETAQVELWEAAFLVSSWVFGRSATATHGRLAGAGLLSGVALGFQYAAAPIVLVIAILLATRRGSFGRAFTGLFSFAAGTSLGLFALLAPFVWHEAFTALWEASFVFHFLYSQVIGGSRPASVFWIDQAGVWVLVASLGFLAGLVRAISALRHSEAWAHDALRCGAGLGLVLSAAWLSVAIQGKFWIHHHIVLLPFAIAALLWGLRAALRARPGRVISASFMIAIAGLAVAPTWPSFGGRAPLRYTDHLPIALEHLSGLIDRNTYIDRVSRSPGESEARGLGMQVAQVAKPGEGLCVLGYEPLVYTTSRLRCPSRFFVTLVLRREAAGFREGTWVEDYRKAIQAAPPEFFLAPDAASLGPFEVPYEPWQARRTFTVFRRVEAADPP